MNRRMFLRVSAAATGGLLVSMYFDFPVRGQEAQQNIYPPDAFVHIRPDGKIVVTVNRCELGQGVATALPTILADEMDADWSAVVADLAPAADVYSRDRRRRHAHRVETRRRRAIVCDRDSVRVVSGQERRRLRCWHRNCRYVVFDSEPPGHRAPSKG